MSRIANQKFSRRTVTGTIGSLALIGAGFKLSSAFAQQMDIKRTPENRFSNLSDFQFQPHFIDVTDGETGTLRMHYLDEGPRDGHMILCLHGQASWSYLYRHMIPVLVGQGFRVIAPDYIGFGRSDKLAVDADYNYQRHIDWLTAFLLGMKIRNVTAYMFDWGGHFGLRIASEYPDMFNRIVLSNTLFPMGPQARSDEFVKWANQVVKTPVFPISGMVNKGVVNKLSPDVIKAYDAPFPDESFKAGPRSFPMIMPISADRPGVAENRAAWSKLASWEKPVLTLFSKHSAETEVPPTKFQQHIPGAKGQPHALLPDAGFYIVEDKSQELATRIMAFIKS
jgi:haloalkane dehalogenase